MWPNAPHPFPSSYVPGRCCPRFPWASLSQPASPSQPLSLLASFRERPFLPWLTSGWGVGEFLRSGPILSEDLPIVLFCATCTQRAHFTFIITLYLEVGIISPLLQNLLLRPRKLNKFLKTPQLVSGKSGTQTYIWLLVIFLVTLIPLRSALRPGRKDSLSLSLQSSNDADEQGWWSSQEEWINLSLEALGFC